MRKLIVLAVAFVLFSPLVYAGDITDSDKGTYVVIVRDQPSSNIYYRLTKKGGNWIMESKIANDPWKNTSCDKGCEYSKSPESDIKTYFPADWAAHADIACIQNRAQAFCRYQAKKDATKTGHVIIALVTSRPIPMFLKRVNEQ